MSDIIVLFMKYVFILNKIYKHGVMLAEATLPKSQRKRERLPK